MPLPCCCTRSPRSTSGSMGIGTFLGFGGSKCNKGSDESGQVTSRVSSITLAKKRLDQSQSKRQAEEAAYDKESEEIDKAGGYNDDVQALPASKAQYNGAAPKKGAMKKSALKSVSKFPSISDGNRVAAAGTPRARHLTRLQPRAACTCRRGPACKA